MENLISYIPAWEYARQLSLTLDAESDLEPPHFEKVGEELHVMTSGDSSFAFDEFHRMLYALKVVAPEHREDGQFDGRKPFDVSTLTPKELLYFITRVVRGDRFNDGLFIHYINNGQLTHALRRLYDLVVSKDGS